MPVLKYVKNMEKKKWLEEYLISSQILITMTTLGLIIVK